MNGCLIFIKDNKILHYQLYGAVLIIFGHTDDTLDSTGKNLLVIQEYM